MGFWGDESCHKNANVVGCALTCELIVLFCSTIYYIDDETDLKDLWFCFWNNVLNFVKTSTLSFQIDIWYIMTVSWILWTEESSWDILNKKSAVFHQQCEHWKAENVKTGLYIQIPKMMLMDSGVVCDGTLLHWGNLLKVYTHSKTCKPRMSGILFRLETVNLRYVLSLC